MLRVLSLSIILVIARGAVQSHSSRASWNNPPPAQPGFPQTLNGANFTESSPILADLDGDVSTLEIVIAGRDRTGTTPNCQGRVYAYRPNGTKYWETVVRAPVNSAPAVADLDGDGAPEVVVSMGGYASGQCWHGGVTALDGRDGSIRWTFDTQDWMNHNPDGWLDGVYSSPAVGDVNNDGQIEIVFGAWDQCIYLLRGSDGTPIWPELNAVQGQHHCGQHGFYNEDTIWSSAALADLDNDGMLEIVIGADITAGNQNGDPTGGYVYVLRYDGVVLAREWLDQAIYSSPAIGEIDKDGQYEIVIGSGTYLAATGYYVKVFNYNPAAAKVTDRLVQKWSLTTSGRVFTSPALADLNGDTYLDIIAIANIGDGPENGGADNGSKVFAWSGQSGAKLFETMPCDFNTGNPYRNYYVTHSSPVVAEVGRSVDTGLKILFAHSSEVAVLNADGTYYTDAGCSSSETTNITYWNWGPTFGSPAVGDIDSDGKVEVVIGASAQGNPTVGALYVWEPGRNVGALPWPMARHDAWLSGRYDFILDKTPPNNPTTLNATPAPSTWTNDNTIDVTWSGASDEGSGIDKYYYVWDTVPSTEPGAGSNFLPGTTTQLTSPPLSDGQNWYFHIRARDKAGNWASGAAHLGPFWIDTRPPTSYAASPPTAVSSIPVTWSGTDGSGSGIAAYTVQVRVNGAAWTNWQTNVTFTTANYPSTCGSRYDFRSIARDRAGNVEIAVPDDGDSHTLGVSDHYIAGRATNNMGEPVFNAQPASSAACAVLSSDREGHFKTYYNSPGSHNVFISRGSDYGELPAAWNLSTGSTEHLFVLPPRDDVIINGHFESGLDSWTSQGNPFTQPGHTGNASVAFVDTGALSQTVTVPAGGILSLVYRINEGSALNYARVRIEPVACELPDCPVYDIDLSPSATIWRHAWKDISALAGQSARVSLQVNMSDVGPTVLIDEVTLGSTVRGVYNVFLPLVLRNSS